MNIPESHIDSIIDRMEHAGVDYTDRYQAQDIVKWLLEHVHYPRVDELIEANNSNVARRRSAETALRDDRKKAQSSHTLCRD